MNKLGLDIDISSSAALQKSLFAIKDEVKRRGLQTLLIKTMQRGRYVPASKIVTETQKHYILNLPRYTHFTNPTRRYADILVHRQFASVLSGTEFAEELDSLSKVAEQCNVKKDSAKNAQEQSIHFELCRVVDDIRNKNGGELICEAIVINVYESAFDVLIPEYGFEKRVHCDQLPLKKAEFDKEKRLLELFWEKGVQSDVYIPEDERPKGLAAIRAANAQAQAAQAAAAAKAAQEAEEAQRKMMEVSSGPQADATDALFDSEDEGEEEAAPAPVEVKETKVEAKPEVSPEEKRRAALKEKYAHLFTLREEKGDYIQEVRELTLVPVFLKTDLSKSPP